MSVVSSSSSTTTAVATATTTGATEAETMTVLQACGRAMAFEMEADRRVVVLEETTWMLADQPERLLDDLEWSSK